MKLKLYKGETRFLCALCSSELEGSDGRLVCPNWSFFSKHYRGPKGTLRMVGNKNGIARTDYEEYHIEVPDAPPGWNSIEDIGEAEGMFLVLNSITGQETILHRSSRPSAAWLRGIHPHQMVTHWKHLPWLSPESCSNTSAPTV